MFAEIIQAVKKIILEFKSKIYVIQADRESAWISNEFKAFLKKEKIIFRPKFGKNKAAIGAMQIFSHFDYWLLQQHDSHVLDETYFKPI